MCHVNILYVCVFNITSPLINIHFLNTLTAAALQSSADISAPCHQFSRLGHPGGELGWQQHEESCSALRAGGHFPSFLSGTSLLPLGSHQVMGTVSVPLGQGDSCSGAVPCPWLAQLCPALSCSLLWC